MDVSLANDRDNIEWGAVSFGVEIERSLPDKDCRGVSVPSIHRLDDGISEWRDGEGERRAASDLTLDPDGAAVELQELPTEGKP